MATEPRVLVKASMIRMVLSARCASTSSAESAAPSMLLAGVWLVPTSHLVKHWGTSIFKLFLYVTMHQQLIPLMRSMA